jgi:hypothetical protein
MLDKLKPYVPPGMEPALVRGWFSLRPVIRLAFSGRARSIDPGLGLRSVPVPQRGPWNDSHRSGHDRHERDGR